MAPPTATSQPRPTFLSLPPELRNAIYALLLAPPTHPLHPSLLRTSRLIHAEAATILYRTHTFRAHPSFLLARLSPPARPAHFVSPTYAPLVTRFQLTVRLDVDAYYSREELVRAFTGAEGLEVVVGQSSFRGAGEGVLGAFEGVRGVRSARVRGSVGRGYAGWLEGVMMMGVGVGVEAGVGKWEEEEEGRGYEGWRDGDR